MSRPCSQAFQTAIEQQFAINPAGVNFTFLQQPREPVAGRGEPVRPRAPPRPRAASSCGCTRDRPLDVRLIYFHEKRRGNRAAGTSFGFGNVVESAGADRLPDAGLRRHRGVDAQVLGAGARRRPLQPVRQHASRSRPFDNPFRATDSTDPDRVPVARLELDRRRPFGRVSLPPDNQASPARSGFLCKFAKRVALERGRHARPVDARTTTSCRSRTNTAITTPVTPPTRRVAARAEPGRQDPHVLVLLALHDASRPTQLHLTARVRRYDLRNETPRISFPQGYVRFDAVWEDIPRISVPYGNTTDAPPLSAAYDFGKATLEGGLSLRQVGPDVPGDGEDEPEHRLRQGRCARRGLGAACGEASRRGPATSSGLDIEHSEHASFLDAGAREPAAVHSDTVCPSGTVCDLRFDQSKRDLDRYGVSSSSRRAARRS